MRPKTGSRVSGQMFAFDSALNKNNSVSFMCLQHNQHIIINGYIGVKSIFIKTKIK